MRFLSLLLWPFRVLLQLLLRPLRLRARRRALKEHGWVELHLEGAITELRSPPRLPALVRRFLKRDDEPKIDLSKLHRFATEVTSDPYAKGVLVRIGLLGGGFASAERVRAELGRIRAAGKLLVVHLASHAGNRELLVAAGASRLLMTPSGALASTGAAATSLYLAETLEKAGIRFEVAARGRYKSAPDQLTRTSRTEWDRAQTQALIDELDHAIANALMEGRRLDVQGAEELMDRCPIVGTAAFALGYVDGLARDEDLPEIARTCTSASEAPTFLPAPTYLDLRVLPPIFSRKKKRVGVVEVHGSIVDRGSPYAPYFGKLAVERAVVNDVRAALEDPTIGAVVLHVDSRGGSVTASDAMYSAIRRLAQEKVVIACFGDVSASGGYYVGCAARAIVCSPLTITGSIGVFAMFPTWPGLGRKLAVHPDVVKNRKNAALHDPWRELDDAGRAHADAEVGAMYESFLGLVAEARKKTRDEVHELAEGRVWTGRAAHERGLIDGLGGLDEAVQRAKEAAGGHFEDTPVLVRSRRYHPRPGPYDAEAAKKDHKPEDGRGELGLASWTGLGGSDPDGADGAAGALGAALQGLLGAPGPGRALTELLSRGPGGAVAEELLLLTLTAPRFPVLLAYAPIDV